MSRPGPSASRCARLAWFLVLWLAGVATLAVLTLLIRGWLGR